MSIRELDGFTYKRKITQDESTVFTARLPGFPKTMEVFLVVQFLAG